MIRRPPRSTLFPSRRSSDLVPTVVPLVRPGEHECADAAGGEGGPRSEEHTSELQSPDHLGCRLLLEKTRRPTPRLSVNVNKVATIRNSRGGSVPSFVKTLRPPRSTLFPYTTLFR